MKRFLLILLVSVMTQINVYSQGWEWAIHLGFNPYINSERVNSLLTDGTNYYAIGPYWEGLNTPGGFMSSNGFNDIFIIKYDASGNQLWKRSLGGDFYPHFGESTLREVAVGVFDPVNKCIYLSGSIVGSVVFEPDKLVLEGSRYTYEDPFIAKMDLDGHFLWAKRVKSNGEDENSSCFSDGKGNLIMLGQLCDTGTIEGVKVPKGGFIARFDTEGNLKWIKQVVEINNCLSQYQGEIRLMGNDMIMGGYFHNTIKIDTLTLVSKGDYDGYLLRMDSTGHVKWCTKFGSRSFNAINDVIVDEKKNIYVSGTYKDSVNFAGTMLKNTDTDFFLAKLDENGNPIWINQSIMKGNTNMFAGGGLAFDNNGMIYATGRFGGTSTFGKYSITTTNTSDMFLARYNTSGQCLGVRNFGPGWGSTVAVDKSNNVVCGGSFLNTVTIGNSTFTSYGGDDIFIAKSGVITGLRPKEESVANSLIIYANPTTGKCTLTIPEEFQKETKLELGIYNSSGILIQQQILQLNEGKVLLNLQAEAKGVYIARLSNGKKEYTGKIIFE